MNSKSFVTSRSFNLVVNLLHLHNDSITSRKTPVMTSFTLRLFLCICLFGSHFYGYGQKHSTCATADLLLLDMNCNESNTGPGLNTGDATGYDDTPTNVCNNNFSGDDYIYVYTATNSLALSLEIWGEESFRLYVTEGCPLTGTCDSESTTFASSFQSLVTNGLTPGQEYYIHISSNDDERSVGQFCMNAELVPAPVQPANDECINATPITITSELDCSVATPGTLRLATASAETPTVCTNINENDDVWFSFVASAESHAIRLVNLENQNGGEYFKHSVWEGSCGALTQIDDCPFTNVSIQNNLTIGDTYYIRVCSQFAGPTTLKFELCVSTLPSPPDNDECSTAVPLFVNLDLPVCYNDDKVYGSVGGATPSPDVPNVCDGDPNDDVWYSFVALSDKHTVRFTTDNSVSTGYYTNTTWTGQCGNLTLVQCNEGSPQQLTGLTIGDTYYIRVYTEDSVPSISAFDVCVATPSTTVENDLCANATTLTINESETCTDPVSLININITEDAGEASQCDGFLDYGMWYTFEAPTNGAFVFESIEGLPGIEVYEGSDCGSLTPIAGECIDPHDGGGQIKGLTGGETYYAMVWTDKSASWELEFCVYSQECIWPRYTATVVETDCPKISIEVVVTDLGSATSVDIVPDIGADSHIGVGLGTYYLYGYDVGVEDEINVTVSDNADSGCARTVALQNADTCIPLCDEAPIIGCGQNVNTGDLTGVGEWAVFTCGNNTPHIEKVYRFNPTEDGDYILHVENISGTGLINYYYRTDQLCETTDWNCLGEVYSTSTDFTIPDLVDGDKVYILVEGQNFYESRIHNFRIECEPDDCLLTATRVYVNAGATGDNTGCSWEHAFPTMQMAFDAIESNSSITEIWVQKGTYYPDYGGDRYASFSIAQSVSIYGSFAGDETDLSQRVIEDNPSTISGDIATQGDTDDNSYHLFTIESNTSQVIIDGFSLIQGNANGIIDDHKTGAAVLCYGDVELRNCTISECESVNEGAAIRLDGSNNILICDEITATGNVSGGNGNSISIQQNNELKVRGMVRIE